MTAAIVVEYVNSFCAVGYMMFAEYKATITTEIRCVHCEELLWYTRIKRLTKRSILNFMICSAVRLVVLKILKMKLNKPG